MILIDVLILQYQGSATYLDIYKKENLAPKLQESHYF